MTDASQEGTLFLRCIQETTDETIRLRRLIERELNEAEVVSTAVLATLDYLETLGVPIDALEHGRMLAGHVDNDSVTDWHIPTATGSHTNCVELYMIVPDSATDTTMEQAKEGE